VDQVASARIYAEGIDYHPEVSSKSSPFSIHKEQAALHWAKKRLRFMLCDRHRTQGTSFVWAAGRIDDPEPDEGALSCPLCPGFRFPLCDEHQAMYMQWKCETCCSIGVRLVESREQNACGVWYCDICHDLPGRADVASRQMCKGNCRFAPHQKAQLCGRCAMCLVTRFKPRPRTPVPRG
jgi:hypothetical protein